MKRLCSISLVIILLVTSLQTLLAQSTLNANYTNAKNFPFLFTKEDSNILEANYAAASKNFSETEILEAYGDSTAMKIYPNPVQELLHIQATGFNLENLQIEIVDFTGRLVRKIKPKAKTLQLETINLKAGNYVLYLTDCSRSVVEKFVKSN